MTTERDKQIEAQSEAELAALTTEYGAWLKANGLNLGSADEHLFDETLTEAQRQWLMDFTNRWEGSSTVYSSEGVCLGRDLYTNPISEGQRASREATARMGIIPGMNDDDDEPM